jgi:hypothetical protein
MNITKQRLVEIIKEELSMGMEPEAPEMEASPCSIVKSMTDMLSGLEHNEAVDIMSEVAESLGLSEPAHEEVYEDASVDVDTAELTELIAAELKDLLKK